MNPFIHKVRHYYKVIVGNRRLNGKLLLCILLPLILLGAGVHFLHAYQFNRNMDSMLRRALRAEEQNDEDKVYRYLDVYVKNVPTDYDARAKFAVVVDKRAIRNRNGPLRVQAWNEMEIVLLHKPEEHKLRRRLIRASMELGRHDDALVHLDILLKSQPHDGELQYWYGNCHERKNQWTDAVDRYARAIEYAPPQISAEALNAYVLNAYVRLASILRHHIDDGAPRADAVMDKMVDRLAATEHAHKAYLSRSEYRKEFHSPEEAEQDMAKALEKAPKDPDVLLLAAKLAEDQNKLEEAIKLIEQGVKLHPEDTRMHQYKRHLYWAAKRPASDNIAAQLAYYDSLPADQQKALRWPRVNLLLDNGNMDQARALMAQMRKEGYSPLKLDYLHARLYILEGEWLKAAPILERVRAEVKDDADLVPQTDILIGRCYEQLGDPERRLAAFARAVSEDGKSIPARAGKAESLMALNKFDEALAELNALVGLKDVAPQSQVLLARAHLAKNLNLPKGDRDWGKMHEVLARAQQALPDSPDVLLLQAEALAAADQFKDARSLLEQALQVKKPDQPDRPARLWSGLLDLAIRYHKQADTIEELFAQAEKEVGDSAEVRLARVAYLIRQQGPGVLNTLKELSKDLQKFSAKDQPRLLDALGAAFNRHGDTGRAVEMWVQLLDRQPGNLRLRLILFELAFQAGKEALMNKLLGDDLPRVEGPIGVLWRYRDVARILVDPQKRKDPARLKEARDLLNDIAKVRPNWSRVPLRLGNIAEMEGNTERAIDYYQEAINRGERQPQFVARVMQMMYKGQQFDRATKLIDELRQNNPASGEYDKLGALYQYAQNNKEEALKLAQEAVDKDKDNYRNWIWLGQMLRAADKPADAEKAFRRAVNVAEKNPEPWIVYIHFLANANKLNDAKRAIEEAKGLLPKEQAPVVLGYCYELVQQRKEAEEQYLTAFKDRPNEVAIIRTVADFYLRGNEFAQAEKYLRKLFEPETKAPADVAAKARRELAWRLAASGDNQRFPEATKLIDDGIKDGQPTLDDLRAKAEVQATRPLFRKEAITLYEKVVADPAATANDHVRLIQLCEAQKDWTRADQHMKSLIDKHGLNPLYLAHQVTSLIQRDELKRAEGKQAELEKVEPNSLRTAGTKARLLKAQKKDAEAVAVLNKFMEGEKDAATVALAAALLDELGQAKDADARYHKAAEVFYRRFVDDFPKQPQNLLTLINFLVRKERFEEALALCDQAWDKCTPESVGTIVAALVTAGKASKDRQQAVAEQLQKALVKKPDSFLLLLNLASVRDVQGDYKAAEAAYKQIIDSGAPTVQKAIALNNLAWQTALLGGKPEAEAALKMINQALELVPPNPSMLDTRAVIYLQLGQPDRAIDDLLKANPDGGSAARHFHLAQAYRAKGDKANKDKALEKAKELKLQESSLHPLERKAYQQIMNEK